MGPRTRLWPRCSITLTWYSMQVLVASRTSSRTRIWMHRVGAGRLETMDELEVGPLESQPDTGLCTHPGLSGVLLPLVNGDQQCYYRSTQHY
ncbi:hypothetical protein BDW60DRAFT_180991, partial [Aspergillus nidulans var. acristatus]